MAQLQPGAEPQGWRGGGAGEEACFPLLLQTGPAGCGAQDKALGAFIFGPGPGPKCSPRPHHQGQLSLLKG